MSSNTTQTTDTHGNLITSSDPTTHPDVPGTQKLKGDVQGAISGSVGSAQAAVGAMMGKKGEGIKESGLEKMSEEDARLAAKKGVPTVGSEKRNTTAEGGQGVGQ